MKTSGAIYFIAYSDVIKEKANEESDLEFLSEAGPFNVYKVRGSSYISGVRRFEVEMKDEDWLNKSIEWYKGDNLDYPIVFAKDEKELNELSEYASSLYLSDVSEISPSQIQVSKDAVEFDVPNVNQPYIIKTTYFPNVESYWSERTVSSFSGVHDGYSYVKSCQTVLFLWLG